MFKLLTNKYCLSTAEAAEKADGNDSAPTRDKDAKLPPHEQPDMIVGEYLLKRMLHAWSIVRDYEHGSFITAPTT